MKSGPKPIRIINKYLTKTSVEYLSKFPWNCWYIVDLDFKYGPEGSGVLTLNIEGRLEKIFARKCKSKKNKISAL